MTKPASQPNWHDAIEAWRLHTLAGFAALIDSRPDDPADPEVFRTIVHVAIGQCGIRPGDLVETFGMNLSTVGRWAAGKARPHPMVRPMIVTWIGEQVRHQLQHASVHPAMPELIADVSRHALALRNPVNHGRESCGLAQA